MDVARSNPIDRLKGRAKPRRRYHKAQDAAGVPLITALVSARPTYGYRRITAILTPCFTPVQSPQSNGISEAFVKTLKRDYAQVTPLPDAQTVLGLIGGWIED